MNAKTIKILTPLAYLLMVAANYLAVAIPLGGRTTGEISDSYFNLFAPAGYAFSIWGVIYILLGVYVIYQLKENKNKVLPKINRIFILNALLNISWMFAWHFDLIWLSVIIMIGILATLIRIADTLRKASLTRKERWLVRLPFSIYFGWITVALIANITTFLVYVGWDRFGLPESLWTVIVLIVGAIIGSWRMLIDRVTSYGIVLVWSYGAIIFKHLSASGFANQYPSVSLAATFSILVFLAVIVYINVKRKGS